MRKGKVYIAGAGPGDISLVTLGCLEAISKSDVVIYDHLVPQELLFYAQGATKIYVGKESGKHTMTQDEINSLLVKFAKEGKIVTRLKGGDPFIFGRGGEECEFLAENGVEFEVIPGVSSFYAVPAYAGIPLTHRDFNSSFSVATGSEADKDESKIDFESLAKCGTTVFLMTVRNLRRIAEKLQKHLPPTTPCALIEWGTTPKQRTITSDLLNIADEAEKTKISPPAIFIVGEVVKLREKITWFEKKPLFGKTIVITRPETQALEFAKLIREQGGDPVIFPSIKINFDEKHKKAVSKFVKTLEKLTYSELKESVVIFTSQNGVEKFFLGLKTLGKDVRVLSGVKIAAIGEKTARALHNYGINPDLIPDDFTTESLYHRLEREDIKNAFFLRAEGVRNIEEKLEKSGKSVAVFDIYSISKVNHSDQEINSVIEKNPDIITFTSSLAFLYFYEDFSQNRDWLLQRKLACIGTVTAKTIEEKLKKPEIVSKRQTIEALTEEIVNNTLNSR